MQICKWTSLSSRLFDKSEDFCNMIPLSCKSNWTPRLLQQKVVHLKHSRSFKFLPKRAYDDKTKNRLFTPLLTNHRVANRSNGMSLLVERSLDGRNFVRTGGVRSYDCAAEETQTVSFQTSIQTAVLTKKQSNSIMSVNRILFYSNLLFRYYYSSLLFEPRKTGQRMIYFTDLQKRSLPPLRTWGHPHPLSCLINLVNFRRLRADSYLP